MVFNLVNTAAAEYAKIVFANLVREFDEMLSGGFSASSRLQESTNGKGEKDELEDSTVGVVLMRGPDITGNDLRARNLVERALESV